MAVSVGALVAERGFDAGHVVPIDVFAGPVDDLAAGESLPVLGVGRLGLHTAENGLAMLYWMMC